MSWYLLCYHGSTSHCLFNSMCYFGKSSYLFILDSTQRIKQPFSLRFILCHLVLKWTWPWKFGVFQNYVNRYIIILKTVYILFDTNWRTSNISSYRVQYWSCWGNIITIIIIAAYSTVCVTLVRAVIYSLGFNTKYKTMHFASLIFCFEMDFTLKVWCFLTLRCK